MHRRRNKSIQSSIPVNKRLALSVADLHMKCQVWKADCQDDMMLAKHLKQCK